MERREFLGSSLMASALAASGAADPLSANQSEGKPNQQFIQIRHYTLAPVGDAKICDNYFRDALIPAANRLGIKPVGVFNTWFGPEGFSGKWLLLAGPSVEVLATLDAHLSQDQEYLKTGAPFLDAPVNQPPFSRFETSLLRTMPAFPHVAVPESMAKSTGRIYELRTYAQPTQRAHDLKVALFQEGGEAASLEKDGFGGVFYAVNIIGSGIPGPTLPSLTYMWVYESLAARQKAEEVWMSDPAARATMAQPKYANSNSAISNILLKPAAYSQL